MTTDDLKAILSEIDAIKREIWRYFAEDRERSDNSAQDALSARIARLGDAVQQMINAEAK